MPWCPICGFEYRAGSTRLLTDGSGTVTDRYAYDAYGSVLSHDCYSGSVSQPYQYVGQLGYYTHYQEPEFGLLQLGVRFYDAPVGRFTQRDPVQHGVDYYEYALGIPTSLADPSGLLPNQGDWAKKAFKCAWKAGKKCAGKTGTEFDMCYWSEFGNCMGKAWTKASCEANVCTLFPRAVYCWNGNACDRWRRGDKHYCQDCCDLKWACCWIEAMMWSTTPSAAVLAVKSCTDENTACKIKCQCPK
jgi:RHS repeat-associated protein